MHLRNLLTGLLLASGLTAFSQTTLKGRVTDTLEKKPLVNAVVLLQKNSDSSLYRFTRTDRQGAFQFDSVAPGKYIFQVSYPKFADYSDLLDVKKGAPLALGSIPLTLKSQLLDRVVIRSAGAIRIKGDTTEFIADSFKVKDGATVEDLLKRFPGFTVNSKGEITAQGQRVGKVLVDGEEFFGNDPTMATQNISAKAVDKVQVFDTKTPEQALTGATTGNEGKTVNIKLKENAKKGGFGRAYAASDFDRYVDAKVLYNRFVGKRKMSVFGTRSKIGTGGLSWEDRDRLGMQSDYYYDELSGFVSGLDNDNDFNDWSLQGLPDSYTAGALYIDKWNAEKQSINGSYQYNRLGVFNDASTLSQNLLSSGVTYQNQYRKTNNLLQRHMASITYQWKLDSQSTLKWQGNGTYKTARGNNSLYSEYLGTGKEFRNRSIQNTDNETEKRDLQQVLTFTRNFKKKKNRSLLATLRFGDIQDDGLGYTTTNTEFYNTAGVVDSVDIADQMRTRDLRSRSWGTRATWVEPLGKKLNLIAEYGYNRNQSTSDRETYSKGISGKYDQLDAEFSNHFEFGAFSHSGKATLRYNGQKFRSAVGMGMSSIRFRLYNIDSAKTSIFRFNNLTPQFNAGYQFRPQTGLNFNYVGNTRQPSIEQLQPIRDNANRLNIQVGNPDLKVGFTHNFRMSYNSFKTLSQRYFMAAVSFTLPVNAITNYTTFDVNRGKQITQPVNVNGNHNWNAYINLFRQAQPKKLGVGFNINANGGRTNNFVDEVRNGATVRLKNTTNYAMFTGGPTFTIGNEEKFNFSIYTMAGYNISESSLRPETNNRYWSASGNLDGFAQLPWKMQITTELNYSLQERIDAFGLASSPNRVYWQAELSKKFLKKDAAKISIIANDILNMNRGFDRNISSNFITENRYSRVGQYFLLKLEYSFTKTAGGE